MKICINSPAGSTMGPSRCHSWWASPWARIPWVRCSGSRTWRPWTGGPASSCKAYGTA